MQNTYMDITERNRLEALRSYNISAKNIDLSFILEAVKMVCEVDISVLTTIHENNIHVLASSSLSCLHSKKTNTFDRKGSYSQYILSYAKGTVLEVKDTRTEDELNNNNILIGGERPRYFAGLTFADTEGNILGTLSIFNRTTKTLNAAQKVFLEQAAKRTVHLLITNRKMQVLARYDKMLHETNSLKATLDHAGRLIETNDSFLHFYGWSYNELANMHIFDLIHKDEKHKATNFLQTLDQQKCIRHCLLKMETKRKEIKWVRFWCVKEEGTNLIFLLGKDITDIENKKIELRQSEALFRSVFENTQSLMCLHDLKGNIILANRLGADMTGYSHDEIHSLSLYDLIAGDFHFNLQQYLDQVKKRQPISGIMTVVKKDGERRVWLFRSILKIDDTGKEYVIGSGVDITDNYIADAKLKEANENFEKANRTQSEFIANMSHEIRTPLNGIIGFTDLLLTTELDETQKQYTSIINQSGTALLSIVNDILDFSKFSSDKLLLNNERVNLENLASESFNLVSYTVEKKGLEMLMDLSPDLPHYIWTDELRLKQVLLNLLSNAVKFTEQGEIKLGIYVNAYLDDKISLRFEVRDTGIGIQEDKQKEIFQAFTQENSSITKKYGGTGLGLTIANQILAMMGSELRLESQIDRGSVFSFSIELPYEHTEDEADQHINLKRALVVDDNDNNRLILKRMLEIKHIQVDEAKDGKKALKLLSEGINYDVFIVDYHMPAMDGITLIKEMYKQAKNVASNKFIIMLYSSSDDHRLQEFCDKQGIQSRLIKPIKMQAMYKELARLTRRRSLTTKHPIPNTSVVSISHSASLSKSVRSPLKQSYKDFKILIAEDKEINLILATNLIRQIAPKANIIKAKDGREAVAKASTHHPDLILMDIQMPHMDGMEATQKIKNTQRNYHIPIIAMTAANMEVNKGKYVAAGMDDFLEKPITKDQLAFVFQKWLNVDPRVSSRDHKKAIEHLNLKKFKKQLPNDYERNKLFIQMVWKDLKESKEQLRSLVKAKDLKALRFFGHKLKNNSFDLGMHELSKLAVSLERLQEYDECYVNELKKQIFKEIKTIKEQLKQDISKRHGT